MRRIHGSKRRALVLAACALFATALIGCNGSDNEREPELPVDNPPAAVMRKIPNTGKPTLFEVRRGPDPTSPLVAAVMDMGQPIPAGKLVYAPAMLPIGQEGDTWHEVGETEPPGGLCAMYGPQLADAREADYDGSIEDISNDQPCPQ